MSSFSKVGKRETVRADKRLTKRHMKAMYRIMGEVTELAKDIHNSKLEYTEDTIEEVAAKFSDLKIGSMEKFLLLGNLQRLESETIADNNK